MDTGDRVRLGRPAPGHGMVHGEVVEINEERNAVLVAWDGHDRQVWYKDEDLVPVIH